MPAYLGKSKWKVLGSIAIRIKMTCKVFWWFYCVDKINTIFVYFFFLVCLNDFQLLLVLIILGVWLIVCLELRVLTFFLFLLFHHLVAALVLYQRNSTSSLSSGNMGGVSTNECLLFIFSSVCVCVCVLSSISFFLLFYHLILHIKHHKYNHLDIEF